MPAVGTPHSQLSVSNQLRVHWTLVVQSKRGPRCYVLFVQPLWAGDGVVPCHVPLSVIPPVSCLMCPQVGLALVQGHTGHEQAQDKGKEAMDVDGGGGWGGGRTQNAYAAKGRTGGLDAVHLVLDADVDLPICDLNHQARPWCTHVTLHDRWRPGFPYPTKTGPTLRSMPRKLAANIPSLPHSSSHRFASSHGSAAADGDLVPLPGPTAQSVE